MTENSPGSHSSGGSGSVPTVLVEAAQKALRTLHCDVLVVGGGVAGALAAVAAARAGADTLLVERRAYPGGTGVAGLHRAICGLYANAPVPDDALIHGGLVREVCDRLRAAAPDRRPVRLGKVDVLPYDPAQFAEVYRQMLAGATNLRTAFRATVRRCHIEAGAVRRVEADGLMIVPRTVVDCSGEGAVIRESPALHEPAPQTGRQLAGFTVRVCGLARTAAWLPVCVPYTARKEIEAGRLDPCMRFTSFMPGDTADEGYLRLNLPSPGPCEGTAWAGARHLLERLKASLPAFRDARLSDDPSERLEREGPRLKGLYTLTGEDVLGARTFPDAVVRSAWPIEIWDPERGPIYRYLEPGTSCGIPLRCLKSAAADNVFGAGRCISATREALGATRVMGCCMALGEAAGRAAAKLALASAESVETKTVHG